MSSTESGISICNAVIVSIKYIARSAVLEWFRGLNFDLDVS